MRDRMLYGFISGIIASTAQSILNLISYYVLDFSKHRLLDFMSEILYGRLPLNAFDTIFAQISVLFFGGVLGIGYSYLIPLINSRYYIFKGWIYSVTIWFVIYVITVLFKLPDLYYTAPYTALSNVLTASVYGFVLAESTRRLVSTESPI